LLNDKDVLLTANDKLMTALKDLKAVIISLEDRMLEKKSRIAASKLSSLTEEERRILHMWPEEKKFFLKYKKEHPENPWGYQKEYQKSIRESYKKTGKIPAL
jgi:hypothetical protein